MRDFSFEAVRAFATERARELLADPEFSGSFDKAVSIITIEVKTTYPDTLRWYGYASSVAEHALKARVTIGRCRSHGGKGVAYYWPRAEGRLSDTCCPLCGYRLAQTTLALQVPFRRLPRR